MSVPDEEKLHQCKQCEEYFNVEESDYADYCGVECYGQYQWEHEQEQTIQTEPEWNNEDDSVS